MKKHDLKIAILRLLMLKEMHGYEIGRHLTTVGQSGQLSYIYQILSEMRKEGLIKSIWLKGTLGAKKKVYSLDTHGWQELQNTLHELVNSIHEFYMDYLARLPPEKWLLKWERMITNIVPELSLLNLVFVTVNPQIKTYQFALEYYSKKIKGDIYLVTQKSKLLTLNLNNVVVLNGDHTNIPLKKNFADAIIAFDPPQIEILPDSIAEFCRVVKEDGVAALGFPNLEEQDDPLTIGAYIERIQYGLENKVFIDEGSIRSTFEKYFKTVTSVKTADFTFFIGKNKIES